jgi:phosphatidylserine decarboxylase
MPFPTTPRQPESVQPGGGWCMQLELAWGRLRRSYLRRFRPGYVRTMQEKRQGSSPNHESDVIDPRDLKYIRNVCGFSFRPEDDHFQWRSRLGFARYGLAELVVFTLAFVFVAILFSMLAVLVHRTFWILALPVILVWLEIVYFFRDPERAIAPDANALVSPADGTITNVEEVDEPDFQGGRALRISIFLSIFNVHVNRIPRTGTVVQIRYFPGAYLDARNPESAVRNEQLWIDMVEPNGRPLRIKQISGAIARRIVCWLKAGDQVVKGERLGMIKLGSRTDVLLPAALVQEIYVKKGDKVRGGASVLLLVAER